MVNRQAPMQERVGSASTECLPAHVQLSKMDELQWGFDALSVLKVKDHGPEKDLIPLSPESSALNVERQ